MLNFCCNQGDDATQSHWTDPDGNLVHHRTTAAPSPADLDASALLTQLLTHIGRSSSSWVRQLAPGSLLLSHLTWEDMGLYTCTFNRGVTTHSLTTFLYPLMPDLMADDESADGTPLADNLNQLPFLTD